MITIESLLKAAVFLFVYVVNWVSPYIVMLDLLFSFVSYGFFEAKIYEHICQ